MIEVTLYSRQDCHLCEQAHQDLDTLQSIVPHHLKIVDVDSSLKLKREYGFEVPVIEVGPYKLRAPIDLKDLEISLKAAALRESQNEQIDLAIAEGRTKSPLSWTKSDHFSLWISRHYLGALNWFVFIYLMLPFLAPVLMNVGWTAPASWIYKGYGMVCHQLSHRSYFLFGEQSVYPLEIAGIEHAKTLEEVVNIEENDILASRDFHGNEQVGYKVALCQRDIAIYLGILFFGVLFSITNRRIPSIPWYLWVLLGLVPIGIDGLSQLVTQLFSALPDRESTPFFRTITGFSFGIFACWFFYPMVEESMQESREFLEMKLKRFEDWQKRSKLTSG
jgi:uncharacterized membrane protein